MKYLFFLLISLNCFAQGYSVRVAWTDNPEPNITYYTVYIGKESGVYQVNKSTGGRVTELQINDLDFGTKFFFVVTATNSYGLESDHSNEISYFRSGISSQSIEIIDGQKYQVATFQLDPSIEFEVQATTDLNMPMQTIQTEIIRENNLVTIKIPMNQDKLFWRVVFQVSFNNGN